MKLHPIQPTHAMSDKWSFSDSLRTLYFLFHHPIPELPDYEYHRNLADVSLRPNTLYDIDPSLIYPRDTSGSKKLLREVKPSCLAGHICCLLSSFIFTFFKSSLAHLHFIPSGSESNTTAFRSLSAIAENFFVFTGTGLFIYSSLDSPSQESLETNMIPHTTQLSSFPCGNLFYCSSFMIETFRIHTVTHKYVCIPVQPFNETKTNFTTLPPPGDPLSFFSNSVYLSLSF